eukprot:30943-Pelagococcus_subviridis.AAC.25
MSSSPSGARSRRFPRRVFVFVFFFDVSSVSVSSTAASATIAALTASAGSSASASYLSATSSITLASAPSTSSASTTAATSRNAPFASCAGCVQYSCHAARAPSRCLMMVAPRAKNVTFTGGQSVERDQRDRTSKRNRAEERSNRTRLYAASASTTEGGGGGARSPNVAGVVAVHHRNASAADDGRLRLDAASRRSAASDAVDAFDAADGGRRARAVPGRRPIAALPGLRANVGVELKGVRSGVERQRGRGLKPRGARRDATGKVLKESRSPRQRGRMGTSV